MTGATRRQFLLTAAALTVAPDAASAAALPARPLRILVPFPAAGPSDVLVRLLAEAMRAHHAPGVIVENKPGGAGTIATRAALAATPDGTTLLVGNNQTHATAPFLINDAGYEPLRDFRPIAQIAEWPHILVVRKDLRVASLEALLARAKQEPGRLTYGSTGPGSGSHLAAELLQQRAGIRLQHVPYQNAAHMVGDIAAARLDMALAISSSVLVPIDSGQIAALAVAAGSRLAQLPAVPTVGDSGIAGAHATSWLALFASARLSDTTAAALETLASAAHTSLMTDNTAAPRAIALGLLPHPVPAAAFRDFWSSEITRWSQIIQTIGLKPE